VRRRSKKRSANFVFLLKRRILARTDPGSPLYPWWILIPSAPLLNN